MRLKRKIVDLAFILVVSITLIGCQSKIDRLEADGYISSLDKKSSIDYVDTDYLKHTEYANPISPEIFCADPTAVEYNGRLYIFGTNDQQ